MARNKQALPIKKKMLGLVQFERLPKNVFLITRLPATESAQKRQLRKFVSLHRLGKEFRVIDTIVNDPEAITALRNRLMERWTPFPYGSAKDLYEGTTRGFRSHWRVILKEHPAALLFDLALAEKDAQEKQATIEKLESDNDVLQARIIGLNDQLGKLKATYVRARTRISKVEELSEENKRLRWRVTELEDDEYEQNEWEDSDYDELDEDSSSARCTGSYTVILKRDMDNEFCACPDCGATYVLEDLLEVDDERSDLRPPRHAAIAGSIPPHRPRE